jgi:hypothetical protein
MLIIHSIVSKPSPLEFKWNVLVDTLHQNVSKFIVGFIKFWMNLDIFTMVKLVNPLVNGDQSLRIVNWSTNT